MVAAAAAAAVVETLVYGAPCFAEASSGSSVGFAEIAEAASWSAGRASVVAWVGHADERENGVHLLHTD